MTNGTEARGELPGVTAKGLRDAQARRLLEQLRDHYEGERGWVKHVAGLLGVDTSLVSRMVKGERSAGQAVIDGALQGIGLSTTWFSDPAASRASAHFNDWRANPGKPLPPISEDADGSVPTVLREDQAPYEIGSVERDGSPSAAANNPDHWLHHMLRDKRITDAKDRAQACAELEDAFGSDGMTVRLASKVLDLWLAARKGKPVKGRK